MSDNCGSCKFYYAPDGNEVKGYCRRLPPVAQVNQQNGLFPKVYAVMWCGEYKPIPLKPSA